VDEQGNKQSFHSLPAEIRSEIYHHTLIAADAITFRSEGSRRRLPTFERGYLCEKYTGIEARDREYKEYEHRRRSHNSLSPALLATNSHIHQEARGVLYGQPFVFQNYAVAYSILARIGGNRRLIRDIKILAQRVHRFGARTHIAPAFKMLADCTQLRGLFVGNYPIPCRRPSEGAKELYRDGYHFFKNFGSAQGRKDAVVDILRFDETHFERCGFCETRRCERTFRDHLRTLLENDAPRNGKKKNEDEDEEERRGGT
jgi:hypothetical protein